MSQDGHPAFFLKRLKTPGLTTGRERMVGKAIQGVDVAVGNKPAAPGTCSMAAWTWAASMVWAPVLAAWIHAARASRHRLRAKPLLALVKRFKAAGSMAGRLGTAAGVWRVFNGSFFVEGDHGKNKRGVYVRPLPCCGRSVGSSDSLSFFASDL